MKKLQLISGIIIMAFAALICFESSKLSFGTPGRPGPGFFPLGLGMILFFLSLCFVLKTILAEVAIGDPARALWAGLRWKRVPFTLTALLVYALFIDRLGFLICTWILMIYFFWGEGAKRKCIAISGAITVTIMSFIIFRTLLNVRLPLGILRPVFDGFLYGFL